VYGNGIWNESYKGQRLFFIEHELRTDNRVKEPRTKMPRTKEKNQRREK
jgi:hypothetical protein